MNTIARRAAAALASIAAVGAVVVAVEQPAGAGVLRPGKTCTGSATWVPGSGLGAGSCKPVLAPR